ncbi:hypothetical protein J4457_01895 [Candidatus Woesearchaeota archaeon]|nr:hypothetical protein [Candidatus Woesearchaeota archaeon]
MEIPLIQSLAGYAARQRTITIDDIRNMSDVEGKIFFKVFCNFLEGKYPEKNDTILEGVLNIKSHGHGITIPEAVKQKGIAAFPKRYLEKNQMPTHMDKDLSCLKILHNKKMFPIETFFSRTTRNILSYAKEKGANCVAKTSTTPRMDKEIKEMHPVTDFLKLFERRTKQPEHIKKIDDREVPLFPEIITFALEAPFVLFEAEKQKEQFVIALPGTLGNHAEKNHEQVFCYFNNEAIFANEMAKQGRKITILDIDASFANGTHHLLLGKQNITLIGIQVNPEIDPTIYERDAITQKNSFQYNLELATNGKTYIEILKEALKKILADTDILLVTGGVNQYLYDSCGLLCVEAQYFESIGKAIADAAKKIPKIILTQAGGFEKFSHILFLDLASGIQKNLGGKQT